MFPALDKTISLLWGPAYRKFFAICSVYGVGKNQCRTANGIHATARKFLAPFLRSSAEKNLAFGCRPTSADNLSCERAHTGRCGRWYVSLRRNRRYPNLAGLLLRRRSTSESRTGNDASVADSGAVGAKPPCQCANGGSQPPLSDDDQCIA